MDIHQVSVNYLHEQDRILVRINSRDAEEIRLWLTRRLCLGWVPMLRAALGNLVVATVAPAAPAPVKSPPPAWADELNKLHSLKQSDFKTPFAHEAKAWPIGADPLLVTTIRMTQQGNDRLELAFEETLMARKAQARGFQASLETTLLNGFMHLLEQALDNADWQQGTDEAAPPTPSDDLNTLNRPKYLH
jgi:hypothetical protein